MNCDSEYRLILAHVGTLGMRGLGMATEFFFLELREAAFMHHCWATHYLHWMHSGHLGATVVSRDLYSWLLQHCLG